MKILITGGAGYIGSHVTDFLQKNGYDCLVYDNLSRGNKASIKNAPLIIGDIRDREKLSDVFRGHKIAAVIHLAGFAYVGESVQHPMMYWDNNFIGTKTLLEEMIKAGVNQIVFSSTCAVYGTPAKLPITEQAETKPINAYGQSKLACEQMLDNLDHLNLIKSIRFRYFNAAGADHLNDLGAMHDPETRLIPLLIDFAMGKTKEFIVYGDDFSTKDSSAIRDYLHVSDIAIAHKLGLEFLLRTKKTEVINLGTGLGQSVFEIINLIEKKIGNKIEYKVGKRRIGDPAELVANYSKAKALLNWEPTKSIDNIILDTILWHQHRLKN
jgi:UDP-glucose 4-epimerase